MSQTVQQQIAALEAQLAELRRRDATERLAKLVLEDTTTIEITSHELKINGEFHGNHGIVREIRAWISAGLAGVPPVQPVQPVGAGEAESAPGGDPDPTPTPGGSDGLDASAGAAAVSSSTRAEATPAPSEDPFAAPKNGPPSRRGSTAKPTAAPRPSITTPDGSLF